MSMRRSRIKAVANLPARRSRPPTANETKKENHENSDGDDVLKLSQDTDIKPLEPAVNEKESRLCQQSDDTEKFKGPVDRKSVIVSVDKDRKCVIVNRDNCISLAKSKHTLKDERKEKNLAKDASVVSVQRCGSQSLSPKDPCQIKGLQKNLTPVLPQENLLCSEYSEKNVSQNQAEDTLGTSNECKSERQPQDCTPENSREQHKREAVKESGPLGVESSSATSKRIPLRSRRSKPTVNLTAATRKRSTLDPAASSPCSPPPKKIKNFDTRQHNNIESENNNEVASLSKQDENSCASNVPCSEQANLPSSSSSTPLSPEASVRLPSDAKNLFKTPISSFLRTKDPYHGTPSDSSNKTDGLPSTPFKESSALKRKQSTNAQRVAAARKSLKSRLSSDGAPPRSRLTMFDLIFYNPSKNPMISSDSSPKKLRSRVDSVSSVSSVHEDRLNEESIDDVESERLPEDDEEESAMPVPQVKLGPDGSLILDEKSLVIETTGSKKSREELERSEVIIDTKSSYGHYKKVIRSKDWSDHETKKFYRALNVVGTDFSLMKPYFRNRTRRELKLKFKKEEKLNPNLVNKALGNPLDFDISELEKECELEDEEEKRLLELAKEKAAEKSMDDPNKIPEKSSKRTQKKKTIKQSRLMAEMEIEMESDTPMKKSQAKGAPKKAKKILDQNAEADYNLLSMGVGIAVQKKKDTKKAPSVASCAITDSNILLDVSEEPTEKDQKISKSQMQTTDIEAAGCSKNLLQVKIIRSKASKILSVPKKSTAAHGITPLVSKNVSVISNAKGVGAASSSICQPVISYHVSPTSNGKASPLVAQSSIGQTSKSVIISAPSTTSSGALQVPCTPKTPVQVVQTSPISSHLNVPVLISPGMTPKTFKIVKRQPLPSQPAFISRSNSGTSSVPSSKQIPLSPSQKGCNLVPALVASSPSRMSTPSPKVVSSTPLCNFSTMQFTPQSIPVSGVTTPVSRLLPSTPPLPRMEPGSIIVLKTPLPQNPDRHILQVYMVTNTPQGASSSPPGLLTPSINLLTGPSVQPAPNKSPCISDESDCEKVLTKL